MSALPGRVIFCFMVNASSITFEQMLAEITAASVADALDALGFKNQSPSTALPPQTGPNRLVGRCKTTLWADMAHNDSHPYELELQAVDSCQSGDILIAAAGGSMRSGIWGELLSTAACHAGCAGAIIDGAVRDVKQMTEMQFPVFARGRCVYDSLNRQRVIDVDVPVNIGNTLFSPGQLLVADLDGIVVIPQQVEEQAVTAAWNKIHAENVTRDAIKAGMKAGDAYKKYGVL